MLPLALLVASLSFAPVPPARTSPPRCCSPRCCAARPAKRVSAPPAGPATTPAVDVQPAARAISEVVSAAPGSPTIAQATELLEAYDAWYRLSASEGGEGPPTANGATTANALASRADRSPLAAAVRALATAALARDSRLMLGICAADAAEGLATLKRWVGSLGLPRGTLHGMDDDGVPIDMSDFGAVYIKYDSSALHPVHCPRRAPTLGAPLTPGTVCGPGTTRCRWVGPSPLPLPHLPQHRYNSMPVGDDAPGSALLSGYGGPFRGVYQGHTTQCTTHTVHLPSVHG